MLVDEEIFLVVLYDELSKLALYPDVYLEVAIFPPALPDIPFPLMGEKEFISHLLNHNGAKIP